MKLRVIITALVLVLLAGLALLVAGFNYNMSILGPRPSDLIKVSLIFDVGGLGDNSYNDMAYAGLERAMEDFKGRIIINYFEPADNGGNWEQLLRLQGQDRANLVMGVGFSLAEPLEKVAKEFPNTKFAIVDGSIPNLTSKSNITCLLFRENEGSFLMGAAAALKSKTGRVGFVGGMDSPIINKFEAGFTAGARYINRNIKVYSDYIGTTPDAFIDSDRGQALALEQYDEGADVVYHAAGAAGLGVLTAAQTRQKLVIGVDSDQSLNAPPEQRPYILTSMTKRVDVAVYDTIKKAVNNQLTGGYSEYGLKEGAVGYAENEYNKDMLAGIKNRLEEIKSGIISGAIAVPANMQQIKSPGQ